METLFGPGEAEQAWVIERRLCVEWVARGSASHLVHLGRFLGKEKDLIQQEFGHGVGTHRGPSCFPLEQRNGAVNSPAPAAKTHTPLVAMYPSLLWPGGGQNSLSAHILKELTVSALWGCHEAGPLWEGARGWLWGAFPPERMLSGGDTPPS